MRKHSLLPRRQTYCFTWTHFAWPMSFFSTPDNMHLIFPTRKHALSAFTASDTCMIFYEDFSCCFLSSAEVVQAACAVCGAFIVLQLPSDRWSSPHCVWPGHSWETESSAEAVLGSCQAQVTAHTCRHNTHLQVSHWIHTWIRTGSVIFKRVPFTLS